MVLALLLLFFGLIHNKVQGRFPSGLIFSIVGMIVAVSVYGGIQSPALYVGFVAYIVLFAAAWSASSTALSWIAGANLVVLAANGLLIGAILQSVVSVFQLSGHDLGGLIMPKLYNSTYGNIAQPNHFGDLLWLGQVSLIYLWANRRLPALAAVALTATISIFATLSASRAVWLYTFGVPLVAFAYALRRKEPLVSRMAMAALVVSSISVFLQLFFAFSDIKSRLGVVSSISRANDAGSNGQRLFDWMVAWKTSLAHPWTGSGLGSFSWQTALHSIGMPPPTFIRIAENAHDTPLHFLAELGWPFMLVMTALCGVWLWRRWRTPASAETLWGLGIITVIGAHSLVEYPLWYTYFLIPFAFAVAVVDAADTRAPVIQFSSRWFAIPAVLLAIGLAWSFRDYKLVERGYADFRYEDDASSEHYTESREIVRQLSQWSLFAVHARALQIRAWPIDERQDAPEVARLCDQTLHVKPTFQSLTQCAFAYADMGREVDAAQAAAIVCGAYPAIYHGDFGSDLAAVFKEHGWRITPEMYCVKP